MDSSAGWPTRAPRIDHPIINIGSSPLPREQLASIKTEGAVF